MISKIDQGERQQAVFERQRLVDRCMGKLELAERLMRILGDGLPNDLVEIQSAVEKGDMSCIAKLAHRMKGAAANMCADKLASAAAMLERSARSSNTDEVSGSLAIIEREIGLLLDELQCH